MQIKVTSEEEAQITLEVEIPKEKVQEAFSKAFKKLAKEVHVPGFRRGKVPRKIFEQRYGKEAIEEEALKELYSSIYPKILEEKNIKPLIYPRAEAVKFTEEEPAIIKVQIVTKPEVKLGSYKGIKVKKNKIKVTEEEILEQLKELQKRYAEYPPLVENRPTQEGDLLALDMEGFIEGKALPEFRETNFWYQLGSEQLPSSFRQKLLGANIGDEKTVEMVIPPDHPQRNLAGKKMQINVKVKDIRKEKLPPLDDEFAKKLGFESMEKVKERIKKELEKYKEEKEKERIRQRIIEKVVKNSKVNVPSLLVEEDVEDRINKLKEELKEKKISFSEYLARQNITEEKLREILKAQAEMEAKILFVLDEIAQKEKIEIKEKDIDETLKTFTEGKNKEFEIERLKKELVRRGEIGRLIQRIRNEKVVEFLYEHANIS